MASDFLEFNHPSGKNGEERRGQRGREWGEGDPRKSANYTDRYASRYLPANKYVIKGNNLSMEAPRPSLCGRLHARVRPWNGCLAIIEPSPATTQRQF